MINMEKSYKDIISSLYLSTKKAYMSTKRSGPVIAINGEVRQGDPQSPILFILVLESVFWTMMGIKVNGKFLYNLRSVDDIELISKGSVELQEMLKQLVESCKDAGLVPNFKKIKIMKNSVKEEIKYQKTILDYVELFTYLGQIVSLEKRVAKQIQRRTSQG